MAKPCAGARLAGALLAGAGLAPAIGQTHPAVDCQVTALPVPIHADGIAEPIADLVLACSAEGAGALPQARSDLAVDIEVALNAAVTNRRDFGSGEQVTTAVLTVAGNDCPSPSADGSVFGSCGAASAHVQDPQYGRLDAAYRLRWPGVALPFPGALRPGSGGTARPGSVSLRIRGIRANASQLRTSGGWASAIRATVSIDPHGGTGVLVRDATVPVAYPVPGLVAGAPDGKPATACLDERHGVVMLSLLEGFASAFSAGEPGGASPPTRILLDFQGVPDGFDISVPSYVGCQEPQSDDAPAGVGKGLALGLVQGHDADGHGGMGGSAAGAADVSLELVAGSGQAVYEVLAEDPVQVEGCRLPVRFASDTALERKAHGRVSASLAPRSAVFASQAAAPERRFAPAPSVARTELNFAACRTTLMFPFVTNQAGFDTGLVITHGSLDAPADPTAERAGSCDLHYFGATDDNSSFLLVQHSTPIAAGEQLVMTVSGGNTAQNIIGTSQFQGYLMAVCGFPGAHGYAFISDGFGGIADLATGYLAPIVATDPKGDRIAPGAHATP